MINTSLFPVSESFRELYQPNQLGFKLSVGENTLPNLDELEVAIIGIGDKSPADPNAIRAQLYDYYWHFGNLKAADLGDFIFTKNSEEEAYDLAKLVKELLGHGVAVILLGGHHRTWYSTYGAYELWGKPLNLVSVDRHIDFIKRNEHDGLLKLMGDDTFLSHYVHLGYQTYFTNPDAIKGLADWQAELYRLGVVKSDLKELEPIFRNANALNFNAGAVQSAFVKAKDAASANGFTGEEACSITRYAGMSPDLKVLGINNFQNSHEGTSKVVAQLIWYFLEGFEFRIEEDPLVNNKRFTKYITDIDTHTKYHLAFYKSRDTEKWWMHIPVDEPKRYHRSNYLIPCSYKDYQTAQKGEIPDRWLKAVSRLERSSAL